MEPAPAPEAAATAATADILDRPDAGVKVIRGGALRGLTYVATIALTAATVPLMTRHLGVADFGRFVTASSIVMIVAGVTELGLTGVGTREYALAPPSGRGALVANLLGLRTALTLAGLAIATPLAVLAGYSTVVVAGILVSGAGLMLLNVQQTYTIALTAQLRWGVASVFELVNALVIAAATVLLVLGGAHVFSFFFISVVSSGAALAAAVVYLRGRVSLLPMFEFGRWMGLLRDTLPYAAAVMVGILYPRIGLVAVSLISDAHQTGYYSTAFKIVEVIGGTSGLIASSAFPVFARAGRDDHERLRYAAEGVAVTALLVGTYVTLSLVVAAPFVIEVLGGGAFAPAISVLRLQALALLGGFLAATSSYTLLALRMHGALLRVTIAALATSIALSAALVPSLGARGASIASAACEFLVAGALLRALARRHPQLVPRATALPRVALAAAAGAAALLIPLPSVAQWAIASAAYLTLVLALGVVPREIAAALVRRSPS